MELEIVKLDEVSELEPLVIKTLNEIENGLTPIENQIGIGEHGRPDILAVDIDGSLSIVELKSVEASIGAIEQIVRYYDWFVENIHIISRSYQNINPNKPIRLFLVATNFPEDVLRLSKYVDLDLSLIKVIPVREKQTQKIGVIYEYIDSVRKDTVAITFYSIDDIIKYIKDDAVKSEFVKIIDKLKSEEFELKPWKGGKDNWIECIYDGEEIGYLRTRRNYFNCQYFDHDKDDWIWPPMQCTTYKEWKNDCKPQFDFTIEQED